MLLCAAFQFPSQNVSLLNESMDVKAMKRWYLNKIHNVAYSISASQARADQARPARKVKEALEEAPSAMCPGASWGESLLSSVERGRVPETPHLEQEAMIPGWEQHSQVITIYTSFLKQSAFSPLPPPPTSAIDSQILDLILQI